VQLPLLQYDSSLDGFTVYNYSLLYIVCFALSLVCRNNYAFVATALYLVSGLCGLPVFAFGGGYGYIWEPSFGYLIGLLPLSAMAFYIRYRWDALGIKTFNNRSILPLLALILAHLIGLIYLLIMRKFTVNTFMSLTGYQLLYDIFWAHLLIIFLPLRIDK
jgi:biotin transport system substrate-specific component